MIRSARDTAGANFIMGLYPRMVLRVQMEKPESLQKAIVVARSAEWETKYTRQLSKNREDDERDKSFHGHRFRPYQGAA